MFRWGDDGVGNGLLNAADVAVAAVCEPGVAVGLPDVEDGDRCEWFGFGSWSRGNVTEVVVPIGWSRWHLWTC